MAAKLKEKAFWIAVGDIAGRGLSFVTSIYLARTLGSEFYGLITVAISILGYATWISDLGLNNIGTRETAKEPSKRIFRVLEIFRTKLFLGTLVLIGSTLVVSMIDMGEIEKQVVLGYLYSIIPYMALLDWFYSGKQQFGKIALSKVLNGLFYFLLVFFLVDNMEDVTLVPVLYTVGVSVAALTLGTFAIQEKPFALPSRGLQIYPDLLKSSSILGMGQFFAQIVHLLPPILIGAVLSLKDAGLYGAAFRIVIVAMMIDRVFVNLLLPNLASIWSIDRNTAMQKIAIVFRFTAAGGAFIALLTAVGAEEIIGLLYGNEYQNSVPLLQLLSVMIAVTFINSLFSFGLIATNKDREYFLATCFGGTISAIVIFSFAALGNVLMAAAAVSVSEVIITSFTFFWFRKAVPLNFLRPILISYSTALALFFLCAWLPFNGFLNMILAGSIFTAIIWWTNIIDKEHYAWAKQKLVE
ncbi:oligosaccharide flippase family protein [Gracilimonas tropica]|uniref:oligosaccharide flippase family protein n=1 Tax=Gracilimonas tropica TaxID=454600 RepID=UPI00037A1102|nr:oligosaccharide flippase family protein [Gracilimonas tropica]